MKRKLWAACIAGCLLAAYVQAAAPAASWSNAYGGADKSYDTELLSQRDTLASKFQQFEFKDEKTGVTMAYNLFVPKNIVPGRKYPLVLFIADASTAGKGVKAPLMQGWGGIIWASDDVQSKHPAFVLVPSYAAVAVNDDWQTTAEVPTTLDLLDDVVQRYPVDTQRLYTTGQSMGGMMSFYFNATRPHLFAASLFVGSQWDTDVLKPLARQKFMYIVGGGDAKASKGMADLKKLLDTLHADYAQTEFSARLPESAQNAAVQTLLQQGKDRNFVQFSSGSVLPEGTDGGRAGDHMYSFDYAYKIPAVREWLLSQRKTE